MYMVHDNDKSTKDLYLTADEFLQNEHGVGGVEANSAWRRWERPPPEERGEGVALGLSSQCSGAPAGSPVEAGRRAEELCGDRAAQVGELEEVVKRLDTFTSRMEERFKALKLAVRGHIDEAMALVKSSLTADGDDGDDDDD